MIVMKFSSAAAPSQHLSARPLLLSTIESLPGSKRQKRRLGRGIGSSKGKTCGRGHKGTGARRKTTNPRLGFEGGQTPLSRRIPKWGFSNINHIDHETVSLAKLQWHIDRGDLDNTKPLVTMRDLKVAGVIRKVRVGVKLLATGREWFKAPINLEVARVSKQAKEAIEKAGGTVKEAYYGPLNLREHMTPENYPLPLKRSRPPPRLARFYPELPQPLHAWEMSAEELLKTKTEIYEARKKRKQAWFELKHKIMKERDEKEAKEK